MCQHGCFWVTGAATGELKVCNIIWAYYAVEDVEDMIWDGLRVLSEVVILCEIRVLTSYQAHSLEIW